MPDALKELSDLKEVLVKRMAQAVNSDFAELAKAYAMVDYQIVSRKEKDMEWD